jgi:hypothetical protein
VEESTDLDTRLTCGHVESEYEVNLKKIEDITGEKLGKTDDNIGMVLYFMPWFLDVSGAEQKEIEALIVRNNRLVALAKEKNCKPILSIVRTEETSAVSDH